MRIQGIHEEFMNPRGIHARHFRGIQEGFRPGSPSDHSMARCGYRSIILYCPRVVDCPRVVYCPRVTSSLPERCYISESDQSSKFKGKRFGFTLFENQATDLPIAKRVGV